MITFFVTLVRFAKALWSGFKDPEFRGLLSFVIIILISGTAFYYQIEKWSLLDSFYFSVTTLTTVGFGDLAPKTDLGKIFTTIYLFIGIGTILGFVSLVAHHAGNDNPFQNLFHKSEKKDKPKYN